jgi:adenylate cyclase
LNYFSRIIAEQLGDEKYHTLLKDFFADITIPIVENGGNIYQYVGDEVVIAWDIEEGIMLKGKEKEVMLNALIQA